MNFTKLLRIPFFTEYLWWLLLYGFELKFYVSIFQILEELKTAFIKTVFITVKI